MNMVGYKLNEDNLVPDSGQGRNKSCLFLVIWLYTNRLLQKTSMKHIFLKNIYIFPAPPPIFTYLTLQKTLTENKEF